MKFTHAQKDQQLETLRNRSINLSRDVEQLRFDLSQAEDKAKKLEKHNDTLMRILDTVIPAASRPSYGYGTSPSTF